MSLIFKDPAKTILTLSLLLFSEIYHFTELLQLDWSVWFAKCGTSYKEK